MLNLRSKKFQIAWGVWTLILGVSLIFFNLLPNIHSFSEYLNAFLVLNMPSSWCPTFLTLYGVATLAGNFAGKIFTPIARFAGLVLLPIGLYAAYGFTFQSTSDPLPIYIYAQTIHVSEILTGVYTIFLLARK